MDVHELEDSDMIEDGAPPSSSFDDTAGAVNHENGSDLPTDSAGGGENPGSIPPKLRKRTKTGCLTCRKRRIKCGEERPICSNCIKSKRHCEGYNQRIVFKSSNGWTLMGGTPSYPIPYHTSTLPGSQQGSTMYYEVRPHYGIPIDEHGRPLPISPQAHIGEYGSTPQYQLPQFSPMPPEMSPAPPLQPYQSQRPGDQAARYGEPQGSYQLPHRGPTPTHAPPGIQEPRYETNFPPNAAPGYQRPSEGSFPAPGASLPYSGTPDRPNGSATETGAGFSEPERNSYVEPSSNSRQRISRNFPGARLSIPPTPQFNQPLHSSDAFNGPLDLNKAAVEYHYDDSNWIGFADEELDVELSPQEAHDRYEGELDMMHDIYEHNAGEGIKRDYKNFLHSGILEHYDAETVAHPLKNSHTARVFMHFLTVTALTVSIFERKPRHPGSGFFFDNQPRDPGQGLWTYLLPMMALGHQGLLHAMLSLSSLQVAKIQNTSPTPAYKHYAYAIKRIHGCVGNPRKRRLPSTLAATLLLAFYEVMTADHKKWCSHLAGAAKLVSEIDFRRMASMARAQQMDVVAEESMNDYDASSGYENPAVLDDNLVSKLVGREFTYDPPSGNMADFDPQRHRLFTDLYWWYARHDTFQSIIAGNRLLLKYSSWRHCPPRAAVGKPSAIYGTHDHLILIMARIADFAARDRERKLKQIQANGGVWRPPRPPPNFPQPMNTPQTIPFLSASSTQTTNSPVTPSPPAFFGMAPLPTNVVMPPSYANNAPTPPNVSCSSSEDTTHDLGYQAEVALADWNQMYGALKELETHFGPGFQPLPEDVHPVTMTAFGGSLNYASYDIACIWALYYAAHIIALRSHPDMSPYVMVAAGFSAPQTAVFAEKIGRIAAGMMPGELSHPINPSLGATYCEVTVPLFVAGIQYRDAAQRDWVVRRARELEGLTGWASIGMIAQGCETAWKRAAIAGRGPPYVPSEEAFAVKASWEKTGPGGTKLAEELRPPGATDRSPYTYQSEGNHGHFDKLNKSEDTVKSIDTAANEPGTRLQWAAGLLGSYGDDEADK